MVNWAYATEQFRDWWPPAPTFTEKEYPDQTGRVFVVTGGCTGVGFHVSRYLVEKNAKVWIVARNQSKIETAIADLKKEFPSANLDYFLADFSDLATIKDGVKKFLDAEKRLDVVIHNAGVMTPPLGSKSKDGHELQLSTNNLGPWLLQKYLDPLFLKTAKDAPANSCRIVFVSSSAQNFAPPKGGVNWDDVQHENTTSNFTIYGQSKAINIYQARVWAKHHADSGIVSLIVNPGHLKTELQRHLTGISGYIIDKTLYPANYGAYTELYAALHPSLTTDQTGAFISPWGRIGPVRPDIEAATHSENADRVYEFLEKETAPFL